MKTVLLDKIFRSYKLCFISSLAILTLACKKKEVAKEKEPSPPPPVEQPLVTPSSTALANNTVQDCAMLDPRSQTTGGRKYSFNIADASPFNLFQRCFSRGGRHCYVTGFTVPRPNVFLDCVAVETTSDIEPHHRWSIGLLFDNVFGGQIRVQNRGASGSGHGWAGAQTMFWNCKSTRADIMVESPAAARNWGIGAVALTFVGNGYFESKNIHVQPRSLYLSQLKDRLGNAVVNNITILAQRMGSISSQLQTWAGKGPFNS